MPESKNSQRLTKSGKPRKTKKYKRAFSSATALFEELLKKSVKSLLGRYLCGRNNPKITHRFLCECYKINNYNLGM